MMDHTRSGPIELVLVTGATGYVAGRLVVQPLDAGYRVSVDLLGSLILPRQPG